MKRKVLIFFLLIVTFSVHFCFSEERIARIFASENGLARYVDIDGRIGLVNDSGEVLVNAIYDDISMFDENGLAITTRTIDGETFCGLINKDGVLIVDDSAFCYIVSPAQMPIFMQAQNRPQSATFESQFGAS